MKRFSLYFVGPALLVGVAAWLPARQAQPAYAKSVKPILEKYCISCHRGSTAPGGFDFSALKSEADATRFPGMWGRVQSAIVEKRMPPEGMPRPSAQEAASISKWIRASFQPGECDVKEPGRVTLRRLNRAEYNNTVRDLTGLDISPADDFPSDDVGDGFDNIGDVLSLSPLLAEKYLDAAEKILSKAIRLTPPRTTKVDLDAIRPKNDAAQLEGFLGFYTNNEASTLYNVVTPGEYRIRVSAWATQSGTEPAKLSFLVNGKPVNTVAVNATRQNPGAYEVPVRLASGNQSLGVAFPNDHYDPNAADQNRRDRNLYIVSIEIIAPPDDAQRTEFQRRYIPTVPAESLQAQAAAQAIEAFATQAYRRPVTKAEVARILKVYEAGRRDGSPYERGIQLAFTACLVSPNFLFRAELDNPKVKVRNLTGPELANRLSYFLWSSMPDAELMAAAKLGLNTDAALKKETRRLMSSPKIRALTENFAGQWLQLRILKDLSRDSEQFPDFSSALRDAMIEETSRFFADVVANDRSVVRFLDADYTYVNDALAKLYGVSGVEGSQFRKVSLKGTGRAGLLTQASILTVTSNPTRTSPVKRGKWVMEEILGSPPPPPPPGVGNLPEEREAITGKTVRQRMAQHRTDPSCAVCHTKMDAYGLAFENYDAIGKWRTTDEGQAIEASGALSATVKFKNLTELRTILLKDKDRFVRSLTEKLMTYALGRGLTPADTCAIDAIVTSARANEYKFSSLVFGIVASEPFRKRQGVAP